MREGADEHRASREHGGARRSGALVRLARSSQVLLPETALVDRRIRRRRMRDVVSRAIVEDVEREEIRPRTAAKIEPRARAEIGVAVEPEVTELRLEITLRLVGHAGVGLEPLLAPFHVVPAREVSEFQLLPLSERFSMEARGAPSADGKLLHVQVEHVSALKMQALERLLDIEQVAGEVLEQAHVAFDDEHLLREGRVSGLGLDVGVSRVARRITALGNLLPRERARVVAVEKFDATRAEVVFAKHACGVKMGGVRRDAEAIRALLSERAFVLPHRGRARRVAVLAEAIRLVDLDAREGVLARFLRPPREEHALNAEAAAHVLRGEAALGEPELVVRAPGDGVVALPRIERPFEDSQTLHELGDDEVRVGVAVAVQVAALVDGHTAHRELDVLPFARVEAPHEDLLGVALAALVREEDSGRELEQIGRIATRHARELADVQVEIRCAAARRILATTNANFFALFFVLLRSGRRGPRWNRLSRRELELGGRRGRDHLRRRLRRRKVKRDPDAARDRLARPDRRHERPLARSDQRRFIEVEPSRLDDVDLRHVAVDVYGQREDHVGVLALSERRRRVLGVDVGHDGGRSDARRRIAVLGKRARRAEEHHEKQRALLESVGH